LKSFVLHDCVVKAEIFLLVLQDVSELGMDLLNFVGESFLDAFDVEILLSNTLLLDEVFLWDSKAMEESDDLSVQETLGESSTSHDI
jgi:hypothetical protein